MAIVTRLAGRRARGIVWVCDIASSSKHLNNNTSADALEAFLQRFLFLSIVFVEAAGGKFIKWTGDGFLAWFETPLLRDAGSVASEVLNAAWHLTFYTNVTQLGVKAGVKFKIRHATALEHDALVIDLAYSDNASMDVLGRAVVLAFRLSSISTGFPNIVTHGEFLRLSKDTGTIHFRKLKLSKDDKLKYFKNEKWGTSDIYASGDAVRKGGGVASVLRRAKKAIAKAEGRVPLPEARREFTERITREMLAGPEWCRDVKKELTEFVRTQFLGSLKELVPALEAQGAAVKRVTPPSS